jgi:sigma-B regulation protein RsbU (phosphoserine phosphatase)
VNTHNRRLLLIEDNPGDVDLVRLKLVESNSERDVSFEVSAADRLCTGLAALTKERPAVVLLDLYLPDSRGAETFRTLLNQAAGVPVVVLTGRDDEDLAVTAVQQGAQDYLVKGGFDSKRLGRTLRCAIERQALVTALGITKKEHLQFKERFLSRVSRELGTPLTSIHQFVTTVLEDLAVPVTEGEREHLDTVLRSVNQLRSMIDDQLEATWAELGRMSSKLRCDTISDVVKTEIAEQT